MKICQCTRPNCSFRFQARFEADLINYCPKCGSPVRVVNIEPSPEVAIRSYPADLKPAIEVMLDNVRSVFNVGSIIRTADGAGVRHFYFGGITPTPDHPKMKKTALGSESSLAWTQTWNVHQTSQELKNKGYRLWALEENPQAVPIQECSREWPDDPILLIMGSEVSGVDEEVLGMCDRIFWIPMVGAKRSLNVAVAFGIAIYTLRFAFSFYDHA